MSKLTDHIRNYSTPATEPSNYEIVKDKDRERFRILYKGKLALNNRYFHSQLDAEKALEKMTK